MRSLIAEQLAADGTRLIIGLTSAGRVSPELPLPCLLAVTSAIRDEGTSYHYLPAGSEVDCPTPVASLLERELRETGWTVCSDKVWTTDAPYRETARGAAVTCVAMVSNAVDHDGQQFDTGSQEDGLRILKGLARAFKAFIAP